METLITFLIDTVQKYSLFGVAASFLGGILAGASPCVLPLLPVTMGIIGEAAINSKIKVSAISALFILGLTCTYVALGIAASFLGIFINTTTNSLILYFFLGVLCLMLGLFFFDIVHFPPVFSVHYTQRKNLVSVFVLGASSGLLVLPCIFPILATILMLIAARQDIGYGIYCLLSFSAGYGLVLMLIGASAVFLRRLSKNKRYFIIINRILGAAVFISGLYFIIKGFRYA